MTRDKVSTLLLFGATGDLAHRMLLPSLYFLEHDGLLPDGLKIIGAARSEESPQEYVAKVREAVESKARADDAWSDQAWARLAARLDYLAVDATSAESLKPKLSKISLGAGFKRLFSKVALANFVKGLVKLALWGYFGALVTRNQSVRAVTSV